MAWEPPTIPLQFADFGNALALGTHARYYSENANKLRADEEGRKAAAPDLPAAVAGDPAAIGRVAQGAPDLLTKIAPMLARLDAHKAAQIKERAEYTTNAANAILQANPADRPAIYRELHAEGVRRNYDMSRLPSEYTPQLDPMLRTYRQMGIDLNKQLDRDVRLQIHNTPGGGSGGELAPIMPQGGGGAPAPQPAAPSRPMSSVVPTAAPPISVAQAPQDNEATFLSADPSIKAQPQRSGPMFYEDPTPYGYVMAQDRRKPGQPVIDEHGIRYINPQTKEVVIFKPVGPPTSRPMAPQGYRWAGGQEGQALEFIPGGPYDPSNIKRASPMNNEQARDAGFADRMTNSNGLLGELDKQGTKFWERLSEKAGMGSGYLQGEEYQKFKQARDDFINAQLRRESGAAINADEYAKADKQYFPQPGDKPEVIKQKALNRKIAVEAMTRGAGPSYKQSESVGTGQPAPVDLKKKYGLE